MTNRGFFLSEPERDPQPPRPTRRDWVIALGTGLGLILVALMGADRPPPPGFLAVVIGASILAPLIAFALPRWRGPGARRQPWRPAAEGALVASALWIVAVLLPFSGEPTVSPSATDRLIGAGVAAALGSIGATVLARITR